MIELVLRGGLVLGNGLQEVGDASIVDGRVAEVRRQLPPVGGSAMEIDRTGCWGGPGFGDRHTHLRGPGDEHKEDIASGSRADAMGGFTAVVAMPNTRPPVDSAAIVQFVSERGRDAGFIGVFPAGTLTAGRAGKEPAAVDEMFQAGARLFTYDGDTVADPALVEEVMEAVARLGGVVTEHAIDPGLADGGHMRQGAIANQHGIGGIAAEAEAIIVARDLALVRKTRVQYHLQHVSTAAAVGLVAEAKEEGLDVTAEMTPHHLAFDQSVLEPKPDSRYKMIPPFGTAADKDALRAGLLAGVIDAVATDHAPHSAAEKNAPFALAPFGVIGLADAAPVVHTVLPLLPQSLFERLSVKPAAIARAHEHGQWVEPGVEANIVVFDPISRSTATRTYSKSEDSPYLGRSRSGSVVCTLLRGRITHRSQGVLK